MAPVNKTLPGGVTVEVPSQSKAVKVETRPLPNNMPATPGVFSPGRILVNFVVVEENDPSKMVTAFNPPLKLTVQYTEEDTHRATNAGKALTLAFWNGSSWVPFTKAKHKFTLKPDGTGGGSATLEVSHWGDPPLGWGP